MGAWIALSLLIGAGLMLVIRQDPGTLAGYDIAQMAAMVAGAAVLIFVWSAFSRAYRGKLGQALLNAVSWAAIGLSVLAVYSYRDELLPYAERFAQRIAGELSPGTPTVLETKAGEPKGVRIRRGFDGHFVARTHVNGIGIKMIVDTGATSVVLRPDDAKKIGIDPTKLVYAIPVQTANGISRAARVRLESVAVGPVAFRNVEAMVAQPGTLHQSLLGMSFLSRLRSYEFSGDFLTMRS